MIETRTRSESEQRGKRVGAAPRARGVLVPPASEHTGRDPKDGELCVRRVKPEETLVEARSDTDVQIVRRTCAKGRKTNRTI